MTRYSLFVLKAPLNTKQANKQTNVDVSNFYHLLYYRTTIIPLL